MHGVLQAYCNLTFPLNSDMQAFYLSPGERKTDYLSCMFTAHPVALFLFPAQHPVFLGQERDFIVLTVRSLLIAKADSLLVAPILGIVVRCLCSSS